MISRWCVMWPTVQKSIYLILLLIRPTHVRTVAYDPVVRRLPYVQLCIVKKVGPACVHFNLFTTLIFDLRWRQWRRMINNQSISDLHMYLTSSSLIFWKGRLLFFLITVDGATYKWVPHAAGRGLILPFSVPHLLVYYKDKKLKKMLIVMLNTLTFSCANLVKSLVKSVWVRSRHDRQE